MARVVIVDHAACSYFSIAKYDNVLEDAGTRHTSCDMTQQVETQIWKQPCSTAEVFHTCLQTCLASFCATVAPLLHQSSKTHYVTTPGVSGVLFFTTLQSSRLVFSRVNLLDVRAGSYQMLAWPVTMEILGMNSPLALSLWECRCNVFISAVGCAVCVNLMPWWCERFFAACSLPL